MVSFPHWLPFAPASHSSRSSWRVFAVHCEARVDGQVARGIGCCRPRAFASRPLVRVTRTRDDRARRSSTDEFAARRRSVYACGRVARVIPKTISDWNTLGSRKGRACVRDKRFNRGCAASWSGGARAGQRLGVYEGAVGGVRWDCADADELAIVIGARGVDEGRNARAMQADMRVTASSSTGDGSDREGGCGEG